MVFFPEKILTSRKNRKSGLNRKIPKKIDSFYRRNKLCSERLEKKPTFSYSRINRFRRKGPIMKYYFEKIYFGKIFDVCTLSRHFGVS